jgi:hypothetical protein
MAGVRVGSQLLVRWRKKLIEHQRGGSLGSRVSAGIAGHDASRAKWLIERFRFGRGSGLF